MTKIYQRTIYWFKKDLRIDDNDAFYEAYQKSKEIIPIFIFIPDLLKKLKSYDKRLGFILDCIKKLSKDIEKHKGKLFCYYDSPDKIFKYLIKEYKPDAIFTSKSYSWTVENIDKKIKTICNNNKIKFELINNNFLSKIEKIPYKKVYSAFFKKWAENLDLLPRPEPTEINTPNIKEPNIFDIIKNLKFENNNIWKVEFCFNRIKEFDFLNYEKTRNRLDIDGTSKLSPCIRFGIISLRKIFNETIKQAGKNSQFIKELAWREFWYHIKINFPDFNNIEFQEKRRDIKWQNRDEFIDTFINAKTGYPIIDASIIQLKEEGWMHNRARMIVANFLTKDLLTDWRIGEKFFMEHLLDYDEIVNVGNWQWSASVGPDPRPLRIFNPIIQAQKFDPYAKFIKKYIPELKNEDIKKLHNPLIYKLNYYKPIVIHKQMVNIIKNLYRKI